MVILLSIIKIRFWLEGTGSKNECFALPPTIPQCKCDQIFKLFLGLSYVPGSGLFLSEFMQICRYPSILLAGLSTYTILNNSYDFNSYTAYSWNVGGNQDGAEVV